jgi:hypothetical protein
MVSETLKSSGFVQSNDPTRPKTDAEVPFREIIPGPDHPRIKGIDTHTALSWCESRRQIPEPAWLINRLDAKNLETPFSGFTTDGVVQKDAWKFEDDEGAPVEAMVTAAEGIVKLLNPEQRNLTCFESVDDDAIRLWSNPELYVNPGGLRLDECSGELQDAVHGLLRASTSDKGYAKIRGCCLTNDFLGHLVNGEKILNQHSYNFRLFGEPSVLKPWGYTFFGHHLCLAVVVARKRIVFGPTFMGAEPDRIDEGEHAGLRLFQAEELGGLKLMQSLPLELQKRATLSVGMDGQSLPPDRWNPFDERHLGGARQDNRVVPFGRFIFALEINPLTPILEGCAVTLFPKEQQDAIIALFKAFNETYPDQALAHRVKQFESHLSATYFAWIGPHGDHDPFYYRIHSPVTFLELDFHCGSKSSFQYQT